MRARTVTIAAVVVGAFFAGGVADARTRFNPIDDQTVIHGCYSQSGEVKLANGPAYACTRGWTVFLSSGATGVLSNAAPSGSFTVTGTITVPCPLGGPPDPDSIDGEDGFAISIALLGPDYEEIYSERESSFERLSWDDCGSPQTLPPLTGEIPNTTWNGGEAGSGRILVGARGRLTSFPTISFSVSATPAL